MRLPSETVCRKSDWNDALAAAAKNGSAADLISLTAGELEGLTGTPREAVKHNAVQYIEASLGYNGAELVRLAESLSASGLEIGEELAVFLLSAHYGASPDRSAERLKRLAASPHAPVREWAAKACGTVLAKHFQSFYPELEHWLQDESPFVRKAVAAAVQFASNAKNPARGSLLLNLLEPLMRDNDPTVGKELGPRAWSGLLRHYAYDLEARLMRWAVSDNRTVRRRAAKIFSAPEAAQHVQRLGPALRILLRDECDPVQKAAVSSLLQLCKRIQAEEAAEWLKTIE